MNFRNQEDSVASEASSQVDIVSPKKVGKKVRSNSFTAREIVDRGRLIDNPTLSRRTLGPLELESSRQ